MRSFPSKDLVPRLSEPLVEAWMAAFTPALPEEVQAFFDSPSKQVPAPLSAAERTLGLAMIWSEAKYNFAYWDLLPGEAWWDAQFTAFLPRVAAAPDDRAYWAVLKEFAALLRDGHTGVLLPPYLQQSLGVPPLRLAPCEGQVVVWEGDALPRGSVILTVDGRPAADVQAERVREVETSTPQFAECFGTARILRGPDGTDVTVTARLPGGEVREVTLTRNGPLPARPPLAVHDLGGGLFHVEVNTMMTVETADRFDQAFPTFEGVKGLVLDVRWNGGGSSDVGFRILARLLQGPTTSGANRLPLYCPTIRAWGGHQYWLHLRGDELKPNADLPRFDGPVAVLSGPGTFSAAEDFLVAYTESGRGPLVGEPSGGSTGQPLILLLPGGGAVRICTKRDTFSDGTLFVGRGIQPTVPCTRTLAGLAAGRDEVLERGLEEVRRHL